MEIDTNKLSLDIILATSFILYVSVCPPVRLSVYSRPVRHTFGNIYLLILARLYFGMSGKQFIELFSDKSLDVWTGRFF